MAKVFGLVDCNNFFASCERVFRPDLVNKPVLVLSNNDGCVIARSQEVKALGIKMGVPYFEIRRIVEANNVKVFSTNFSLYGDISNRVMTSLREFVPEVEIYSIDEAFLPLDELMTKDYESFCRNIKTKVEQWTGIPVSIGIASSKTLCKAANHLVKKRPNLRGVLDLTKLSNSEIDSLLEEMEVGDVWGVGWQSAKYLRTVGITTAKQLKYSDPTIIKRKLGITGEKLLMELNGTSCFEFEHKEDKKGISCTRTFAKPITSLNDLSENVSVYAERATEKLRSQKGVANLLTVFVSSKSQRFWGKAYHNSITIRLPYPSSFSPNIVKAAKEGLKQIYKYGFGYKRAGVILTGIEKSSHMQYEVFYQEKETDRNKHEKLMNAVDKINTVWGSHAIKLLATGAKTHWYDRPINKSPRYTTRWEELLEVKI